MDTSFSISNPLFPQPIALMGNGDGCRYFSLKQSLILNGYRPADLHSSAQDGTAAAAVAFDKASPCKAGLPTQVNGLPVLGLSPAEPLPNTLPLAQCTEVISWPNGDGERPDRLKERVKQDAHGGTPGTGIIGHSAEIRHCISQIGRYAACDAPVLITGETGTGKELVARAIHAQSTRATGPFVPVNCGALADTLIENELFGHDAGAYTGANKASDGLISQAKGGTLVLDEIHSLSPKGQVALLRFLENQEFRPVGGGRLQQSDARVLAISNIPVAELEGRGNLRSDLLFRLNVLALKIPALRHRGADVELLAAFFLDRLTHRYGGPSRRLHPSSLDWIRRYTWPGNVRELDNRIHRAFLLASTDLIEMEPPETLMPSDAQSNTDFSDLLESGLSLNEAKSKVIERFEKKYLRQLIADSGGNVTLAAIRSGKERRALGKLLKKHRIDRLDYAFAADRPG